MNHLYCIVTIYVQEMPEVPDVAILHCGILPHMKMGIKVVDIQDYIQ